MNPGFPISATTSPLGWQVGPECFAPTPELRRLDAIRPSLRQPDCAGPEVVYAIVMDVGRSEHKPDLVERHLLFGAVAYAAGRLGDEPVRSQGHIHKNSPRNGWSTPEMYEIWSGKAVILMQETDRDDPGRCFAVEAGPGQTVIVPPGWAHATISADPNEPLVFGAWCDRAYGFVYDGVRGHGGLAFFPLLTREGRLTYERNLRYPVRRELVEKAPASYAMLGLEPGVPIYTQYEGDHGRFDWVPNPQSRADVWVGFTP